MKLDGYINHSGGAEGSDFVWGDMGEEFGVKSNHYYIKGSKSPYGNFPIILDDYSEIDLILKKANLKLKRKYPTNSQFINNLLRRNYFQVKNSEAIFAIGNISSKIVEGGTGWAVQMAVDLNKEIFVFDQKWNHWFIWEDGFWKIDIPILTKNFAGIGTREINEYGIKAIQNVYNKTIENDNNR